MGEARTHREVRAQCTGGQVVLEQFLMTWKVDAHAISQGARLGSVLGSAGTGCEDRGTDDGSHSFTWEMMSVHDLDHTPSSMAGSGVTERLWCLLDG
jgi:hypothetical protein